MPHHWFALMLRFICGKEHRTKKKRKKNNKGLLCPIYGIIALSVSKANLPQPPFGPFAIAIFAVCSSAKQKNFYIQILIYYENVFLSYSEMNNLLNRKAIIRTEIQFSTQFPNTSEKANWKSLCCLNLLLNTLKWFSWEFSSELQLLIKSLTTISWLWCKKSMFILRT